MKFIKVFIALLLVLILVPTMLVLLPVVGLWFAAGYALLIVLGFTQEVLKG